MPVYNLPSKILCRVINVQLKAEPDTDEVFAQVTLHPEAVQDENALEKETLPPPSRPFVHSFCKTLTASDTSTHGGFSILRRHADECFPPLVTVLMGPYEILWSWVFCRNLFFFFYFWTGVGYGAATSYTGACCEGSSWGRFAFSPYFLRPTKTAPTSKWLERLC